MKDQDDAWEELDMEFFLERESTSFRHTRGVSGEQLNIKTCPACGNENWKTYFGLDTGRGNCFVCDAHFNKVSYLHAHYGHGDGDWRQTFTNLREVLQEQGWRPKRAAVAAVVYGAVNLPASDALPLPDGSNLSYLADRGFDADVTKYFALRWCQFGWWKFKDGDGVTQTQNFNNRIIIPVFDLDGEIKTFQGRDLTGTSTKKYLFPMELPGTGRYILNGQNVLATDHVVMGEGAFDVAAIKVALDFENQTRHVVPIGSFGKHLSYGSVTGDDQLGRFNQLKKRGLKIVTIMWDGEPAALIGALNAAKLLTGLGLMARIALLPKEKDPNEVDGSVVRKAFHEAVTYTAAVDIRMRLRNPYA
jgi:DNA primase